MAESISTASGFRGLQHGYSGGGSSSTPHAQYDDTLPEGVDPEGRWRAASSDRYRRIGSTTAERAGIPGYRPGYGRSSNKNATGGAGSLTPQAQWDAKFTPQLGPQMQQQRTGMNTGATGGEHGGLDASGNVYTPGLAGPVYGNPTGATTVTSAPPASPVLPPAATPAPALPVLPPSPAIQQDTGSQSTVRSVTGLPPGQTANATFVPGQNSPQNLAKRTRPPVDPLAV